MELPGCITSGWLYETGGKNKIGFLSFLEVSRAGCALKSRNGNRDDSRDLVNRSVK